MSVIFELWDIASSNLLGTYPTKEEALEAVRSIIVADGPNTLSALLLAGEDDRGRSVTIASGAKLAELARVAGAAQASATVAKR